jgi:succinate dehydrogenase / fumarate reductase cytochrome b subunit
MIFHVFALKYGWFGTSLSFDAHRASGTIGRHMHTHWIIPWFVYPIGILASCYHLANGFWTAAITWGLTISAGAQKRWGYVCGGLFLMTFICGIVALVSASRMDWQTVIDRPAVTVPGAA